MPTKDYKIFDEQINILISGGVSILKPEDKSFAKKMFQHEGYYNLVNGYNKLFLSAVKVYKTGTTLQENYALRCL